MGTEQERRTGDTKLTVFKVFDGLCDTQWKKHLWIEYVHGLWEDTTCFLDEVLLFWNLKVTCKKNNHPRMFSLSLSLPPSLSLFSPLYPLPPPFAHDPSPRINFKKLEIKYYNWWMNKQIVTIAIHWNTTILLHNKKISTPDTYNNMYEPQKHQG